MIQRGTSQGFTAIEVLVTLFIVGFLLAAGYQAYSLVTGDSYEARQRSEASNIAYEALRRISGDATTPCSVNTTPSVSIPETTKLAPPRDITAGISCPFGTTSAISLVTVTITYGPTNETVTHAIYAR